MTLDKFVESILDDIERFKAMWLAGDRKTYPLEMDEGEWYEQFLCWQQGGQDD